MGPFPGRRCASDTCSLLIGAALFLPARRGDSLQTMRTTTRKTKKRQKTAPGRRVRAHAHATHAHDLLKKIVPDGDEEEGGGVERR